MEERKAIFSPHTQRFIVFILLLAVLIWAGRHLALDEAHIRDILTRFPLAVSFLIYVTLYVGLTLLIWVGPKDIFRILGAILFGPYLSTLFVLVAELINAFVLFNISRKLGRGFVEERFKLRERDIDKTHRTTDWWGVFALRINPLIPYRFLDLAYGLSSISFRKYFFVALIGSPLRILWLQIVLAAVGTSVLKDPLAVIQTLTSYLYENKFHLLFNFGYMVFVLIVSVAVAIAKLMKNSGKQSV